MTIKPPAILDGLHYNMPFTYLAAPTLIMFGPDCLVTTENKTTITLAANKLSWKPAETTFNSNSHRILDLMSPILIMRYTIFSPVIPVYPKSHSIIPTSRISATSDAYSTITLKTGTCSWDGCYHICLWTKLHSNHISPSDGFNWKLVIIDTQISPGNIGHQDLHQQPWLYPTTSIFCTIQICLQACLHHCTSFGTVLKS